MNYEINFGSTKHEDVHSWHGNNIRQTYNMREAQHHQAMTQEPCKSKNTIRTVLFLLKPDQSFSL